MCLYQRSIHIFPFPCLLMDSDCIHDCDIPAFQGPEVWCDVRVSFQMLCSQHVKVYFKIWCPKIQWFRSAYIYIYNYICIHKILYIHESCLFGRLMEVLHLGWRTNMKRLKSKHAIRPGFLLRFQFQDFHLVNPQVYVNKNWCWLICVREFFLPLLTPTWGNDPVWLIMTWGWRNQTPRFSLWPTGGQGAPGSQCQRCPCNVKFWVLLVFFNIVWCVEFSLQICGSVAHPYFISVKNIEYHQDGSCLQCGFQ